MKMDSLLEIQLLLPQNKGRLMKKQNKKELQIQAKPWKAWFCGFWLPLIIYLVFWGALIYQISHPYCPPDAYCDSFISKKRIHILGFIAFVIFFLLYHLGYFFFRLLIKKGFSVRKIFFVTLFVLCIIFLFWCNYLGIFLSWSN